MRSITHIFVVTLFVAAAIPSMGSAQTIFVEDFETPDTGNYITYSSGQFIVTATNTWAITANSVDLYEDAARAEAVAFDGAQAVDLTGSPGEGVMEAAFATTPGTQYDLVFHYARNAFIDPDTADALVEVIGAALLLQDSVHHNPTEHTFDTYLQFQGTFTADSTETILRFTALDPGVAGVTIDGISISVSSASDIADSRSPHSADAIVGAHPNPFNPSVTIDYVTVERGFVAVNVYDVRGRFVRSLLGEDRNAGTHSVSWNGTDHNGAGVASGVYFVVLSTPNVATSRRLVLLK